MRVRDHDGPGEESRFLEPGGAGHLTVAVECEPATEDGVTVRRAAWEDRGDPGADRPLADDQLPLPSDDCAVPNRHTGDVGDGVERAGCPVERHAQVAGAGTTLRREEGREKEQREQPSHIRSPMHTEAGPAACRRPFASAPRGPWTGLSSRYRSARGARRA